MPSGLPGRIEYAIGTADDTGAPVPLMDDTEGEGDCDRRGLPSRGRVEADIGAEIRSGAAWRDGVTEPP